MNQQPNVLFLFTDQQRADTIYAPGKPRRLVTPALDALAQAMEGDYDVIVLRSVYYPEEDAYALEQMGKAVWMTHFRYGS